MSSRRNVVAKTNFGVNVEQSLTTANLQLGFEEVWIVEEHSYANPTMGNGQWVFA